LHRQTSAVEACHSTRRRQVFQKVGYTSNREPASSIAWQRWLDQRPTTGPPARRQTGAERREMRRVARVVSPPLPHRDRELPTGGQRDSRPADDASAEVEPRRWCASRRGAEHMSENVFENVLDVA